MLAPLIVFAYNRPEHLKRTLTALSKNPEAKESILYIFIDGPQNDAGKEKNKMVEAVAKEFCKGYFASVEVRNSVHNKGLANAVISGVTEIITQYRKVIVTEDDAVSNRSYLKFMNRALDYYEKDEKIWSIGGYSIPMVLPEDYRESVVLTQRCSSYAWATWKDRWEKIDWELSDYKRFRFDFRERRKFNLWGYDKASMLDDQMCGRINSWAIRFDYAMFKNDMYNVIPSRSLIQNIGHDGSGTHSTTDTTTNDPFWIKLEQENDICAFSSVGLEERVRQEFVKPFYTSKLALLKRFIGNLYRGLVGNGSVR